MDNEQPKGGMPPTDPLISDEDMKAWVKYVESDMGVEWWKNRALAAEKEVERLKAGRGAVWVRASERLPLHKAFWNMPGKHNNQECYFPTRVDGFKYRTAEIFDNRQEGAPDPIYYFVINGKDLFEKDFHRIEWLDESGETKTQQ